jgi:hypothetical protein
MHLIQADDEVDAIAAMTMAYDNQSKLNSTAPK